MTAAALATPPLHKYDRTSVALHWLIALVLVADGMLGLMIDNWPREQRAPIVNIHALLGILLVALTLWRIANRFARPAPPLPLGERWVTISSKSVHGLLYLATLAIPFTGMVTLWLRGRGVDFGIFQMPPMLAENRDAAKGVKEIHEFLFFATMALAALHAAAAVWHQVSLKDRLIERMKF
jgi:cytochrome b561